MYKYENGIITNIPSNKIEAIAKALEITPAYLMGWVEYNNEISKVENSNPADNNEVDKLQLTIHEEKVIIAYRSKTEMQPAVDKLLGIDAEKSTEIIKIAARDGSFTETTITNDDIENINNLPDVDDI